MCAERLAGAEKLTDEDRATIIGIARQALAGFQPAAAPPAASPTSRGGEAVSDTLANLSRKRGGARDLQSVVRSMKAMAASSIGQYEKSVSALSRVLSHRRIGPLCLSAGKRINAGK